MHFPSYAIPIVNNLTIDGNCDDWYGQGTSFAIYSNKFGVSSDSNDLKVDFNLGWNSEGIVIHISVKDDTIHSNPKSIWESDAIELFISDAPGSQNMLQYIISPFQTDTVNYMRFITGDYRNKRKLRMKLPYKKASVSIDSTGYQVETILYFEDLGVKMKTDSTIALQVYVRDYDALYDTDAKTYNWHYGSQTYLTSLSMHTLVLSEKRVHYPTMSVKSWIEDFTKMHIILTANASMEGEYMKVNRMQKELKRKGDYAVAEITFPYDEPEKIYPIYVNKSLIEIINPLLVSLPLSKNNANFMLEHEVRFFEALDNTFNPPENVVLFIGSSSIRRWRTLHEDMPGLTVLNRGFGGSTMSDILHYYSRLVLPYFPEKIVLYEGDNDIAKGLSPIQLERQFKDFIIRTNTLLPGTSVYILSIKPSPAREKYIEKYKEANALLENMAEKYDHVTYIDVSTMMYDSTNILRKELFGYDKLHLNDAGYAMWRDSIYTKLQ